MACSTRTLLEGVRWPSRVGFLEAMVRTTRDLMGSAPGWKNCRLVWHVWAARAGQAAASNESGDTLAICTVEARAGQGTKEEEMEE